MTCDNRKSSLDAVSVAAQTLAAGGLLVFSENNILTGESIAHQGAVVRLQRAGLFFVTVDADVEADAAGEITLQLLKGGDEVLGAQATFTATAGETEHVSFSGLVTIPLGCCFQNTAQNLTVQVSEAATVTNAHIVVVKMA